MVSVMTRPLPVNGRLSAAKKATTLPGCSYLPPPFEDTIDLGANVGPCQLAVDP
jgi:hypothetical protein